MVEREIIFEEEEEEFDKKYEPEEEIPEGQVVDTPEGESSQRPKESRFLSERNMTTKTETKAKVRIRSPKHIASRVQGPEGDSSEKLRPGALPRILDYTELHPQKEPPSKSGEFRLKQPNPPPPHLNLTPTMDLLAQALAGPSLDALDVDEGEKTLLNTIEWQHAAFFNRVKHAVEQYWHPQEEYRRRDPTGKIYGYKDRETILRVVLNPDGTLYRVWIMKSCQVGFLDEEAVEAIHQAAPFPNPPPGLKDKKTGLIHFTFGFILEIREHPTFRIFRYD
jgi:TonB family protein